MPEKSTLIHRIRAKAIPNDPILRIFATATLINTFGNGLFMTVEVIYFTTVVGLSAAKVALALSIAGGVSLLFSIPAGHFADRRGPRDIAVLAYTAEGVVMAGFYFVHSYLPFLFLSVVLGIVGTIGQTMRMAMISKLGTGDARVTIRAYQRSVTNFGIAMGTVFAGIALAINTQAGYQTMMLLDAATFVVASQVFRHLPFVEPTVEKGEPLSFMALKDRRFLGVTALNGIMSLHFVLQNVAIPLWVVKETNAPRWWVSVIMLVNTIGVILFQVRVSRGSGDIRVGAKQVQRAGFAVAAACLLYALSAGVNTLIACTLLIAAMMVHVYGELVGSSGSWSIGFGMADEKHQGQYQGVYSLSWGVGGTIGPSFVTAMAITLGQRGWVYMAIMFAITGTMMHKLVTKKWFANK
jgi:predicted MFS family arabinose efflux permease